MRPTSKDPRKLWSSTDLVIVGLVVVAIVALWVWIGLAVPASTGRPDAFGEQFGAVSALFSGLGFAGLVMTIVFQQRQLALQSDQLTVQDVELQSQKEQLRKQNEQAERQLFEGRLFEMLRLLRECAREVEGASGRGAGAFDELFDQLRRRFAESPTGADPRFRAQAAFGAFWDDYGVVLGRYYRNVLAIIEMVADAPGSPDAYVRIIAAQSSDTERMLQFYFVESTKCAPRTKELTHGLQFFAGLGRRRLLDAQHERWAGDLEG